MLSLSLDSQLKVYMYTNWLIIKCSKLYLTISITTEIQPVIIYVITHVITYVTTYVIVHLLNNL